MGDGADGRGRELRAALGALAGPTVRGRREASVAALALAADPGVSRAVDDATDAEADGEPVYTDVGVTWPQVRAASPPRSPVAGNCARSC